MIKCSKCGTELDDGALFCKECGAPVEDAPALTNPPEKAEATLVETSTQLRELCERMIAAYVDAQKALELKSAALEAKSAALEAKVAELETKLSGTEGILKAELAHSAQLSQQLGDSSLSNNRLLSEKASLEETVSRIQAELALRVDEIARRDAELTNRADEIARLGAEIAGYRQAAEAASAVTVPLAFGPSSGDRSTPPAPEAAPVVSGQTPGVCPNCHEPTEPDAYFCGNCGARLRQ